MNFLNDVIEQKINNELSNIHTISIGRIEAYDYEKKKATVQPLIKKKLADGSDVSYPLITNVPVISSIVNGTGLSLPLNVGDYCVLLFSERSIDQWLSIGGEVSNPDPRMFDLSDAIALPGLMPFTQNSGALNSEDVSLIINNSNITLKPDGTITITNGLATILIDSAGRFRITSGVNELFTILIQTLTLLDAPTSPFVGQFLSLLNQLIAMRSI